jgi:hypothetical protein
MPAIGSVDIDGTAAHALGHPGLRERPTIEPGQNQIATWPLHVAQNAEDLHLEIGQLGAFEDRPTDADHARPDLVHRHECSSGRSRNAEERRQSEGSRGGA